MKRPFQSCAANNRFGLVVACVLATLPCLAHSQIASPAVRALNSLERKWNKVSSDELRKTAETGNAEAIYFFGLREWMEGYKDTQRGWEWMSRALSPKNLTDEEQTASENKWRDLPEAELLKAAESGDRGAQWALGKLATIRASDRARAGFEWMKRAAEQSLPYAENAVALRYLGEVVWAIVPTNRQEGLKWLQRSAEHGFEPAQHKLGDLYLAGQKVPPDLAKGIEYLEEAAATGCARAQYQLATHYADGEGEPGRSGETDLALLQKAAQGDHALALVSLGNHYRTGLGVHKDLIRAIRYYDSAQETEGRIKQDNSARVELILDLLDANLEPRPMGGEFLKFAEVLSIYRKATRRSDPAAMHKLGELCLAGTLTAQSKVEAYRWFNRAAAGGSGPAKTALEQLRRNMSAEDLVEANRP